MVLGKSDHVGNRITFGAHYGNSNTIPIHLWHIFSWITFMGSFMRCSTSYLQVVGNGIARVGDTICTGRQ
ncbi:MAG: hypothetical protein NTV68_14185 [Methanomicrobiales archaeon]|nr:hypothetical protein [Methanomicrobiales archaeon]